MRLWTLNRLIVLFLLGGFVLLFVEIRYAHRVILDKHPIAWTPIVFSCLMMLVCLGSLVFWNHGGRQVLLFGFFLAIPVGFLGFWLHTDGHPIKEVAHDLSVWVVKIPDEDRPPALAPLAFAGLGALGFVACLKQFNASLRKDSDLRSGS